jgi:hypothetical protein
MATLPGMALASPFRTFFKMKEVAFPAKTAVWYLRELVAMIFHLFSGD